MSILSTIIEKYKYVTDRKVTLQITTELAIANANYNILNFGSGKTNKISENYQILEEDRNIFFTNIEDITITLPVAEDNLILNLKRININGNVTIIPNSTEKIENDIDIILLSQYESVTLLSDGTDWYII